MKNYCGEYGAYCEKVGEKFRVLRDELCAAFSQLEVDLHYSDFPVGHFERTEWKRHDPVVTDAGGGEMSVLKGSFFEKGGVNFSRVFGCLSQDFLAEFASGVDEGSFWASGVSVVLHMRSPFVPSAHMNTRLICLKDRLWFGGGIDWTPTFSSPELEAFFFNSLRNLCESYQTGVYEDFYGRCDRYFRLPHRGGISRGIGGIFYDHLWSGDPEKDLKFALDVGEVFKNTFCYIARGRASLSWSDQELQDLWRKRALYAEFNLLYDRGTRFGLMTGAHPEAVLMSLPPVASWG